MKRSFTNVVAGHGNVESKNKKIFSSTDADETDDHSDVNDAPESDLSFLTDTEAAIKYVRRILISINDQKKKRMIDFSTKFPPIVFVHQLYDIVKNKTVVNRQIVGTKYSFKLHTVYNFTHLSLSISSIRKY